MRKNEFSQIVFTNKCKIAVIVMVIMASVPFIQAFSTFVPGTFAIHLDREDAITTASNTLKENIPELNILEYGSLKYKLFAHRIFQPLIWIGHGNKEGITISNAVSSWVEFSKDLQYSHGVDVVLSCYSQEVIDQTSLTQEQVITFNGEIDAVYGSLIVSYMFTGEENLIIDAAKHYWSIIRSDIDYQPLQFELDSGTGAGNSDISEMLQQVADMPTSYTEGYFNQRFVLHNLSGIELGFQICSLLLTLSLVLAIALPPELFSFLHSATILFMTTGMVSLLISLISWISGIMTGAEFFDEFLGTLPSVSQCIWKALQAGPLWEKIALATLAVISGAILAVELFGDALSAGAVTAIRITVSVIMFLLFAYDFMYDLFDEDYIVG